MEETKNNLVTWRRVARKIKTSVSKSADDPRNKRNKRQFDAENNFNFSVPLFFHFSHTSPSDSSSSSERVRMDPKESGLTA